MYKQCFSNMPSRGSICQYLQIIPFWLYNDLVSYIGFISLIYASNIVLQTSFPYTFHTLHWRHNDHGGVSNHQPHGCLLSRLFRRRSKKTSKFRVTGLCAENSPVPVNSPHKGPVTRKMFPFDDVIMNRMRELKFEHTRLSRDAIVYCRAGGGGGGVKPGGGKTRICQTTSRESACSKGKHGCISLVTTHIAEEQITNKVCCKVYVKSILNRKRFETNDYFHNHIKLNNTI